MSDLNAVGFGTTVDMLSNALTGADAEHAAIANNIANVNTPGYHRQTVSFKDALAQAAGQGGDGEMPLLTNADRQFGSASSAQAFTPRVGTDDTDKMRVDGSNVDVDQEMAQLAENSSYGQTMSQLLQVQFMRLREAITEQPH